MSNIGLEIALRDHGITLVRCAVGDKYVMEEMVKRGLRLGGEQSGHVIFSDHLFTGDGIVTALRVLRVMAETGRELADLAAELRKLSAGARQRAACARSASCMACPRSPMRCEGRGPARGPGATAGALLGHRAAARIMIEGRDQSEIQSWASELAGTVKAHLG